MLDARPGHAPIGVAAAAFALLAIARYRRDLRRDQERLAAVERRAIETPFGRVEYPQAGYGPPVLVSFHGVLGGCDFGVGVGRVNVPPGYRVISPSRFGFMGSPFPPDPSPAAAQADAFAALLDHLELAAAAGGGVLGWKLFGRATRASPPRARLAAGAGLAELAASCSSRCRSLRWLFAPNRLQARPVLWAMRLLARSRLEERVGNPGRVRTPTSANVRRSRKSSTACSRVGHRVRGTVYDGYVGNVDTRDLSVRSPISVPTLARRRRGRAGAVSRTRGRWPTGYRARASCQRPPAADAPSLTSTRQLTPSRRAVPPMRRTRPRRSLRSPKEVDATSAPTSFFILCTSLWLAIGWTRSSRIWSAPP